MFVRDFNRNKAGVWESVIGEHGDANINDNKRLTLQKYTLHHENFHHRDLHKCT